MHTKSMKLLRHDLQIEYAKIVPLTRDRFKVCPFHEYSLN